MYLDAEISDRIDIALLLRTKTEKQNNSLSFCFSDFCSQ
jgi:hypothetical protein